MHELILALGAGSSLVVTITIIVDTSAQVRPPVPRHLQPPYVAESGPDSAMSDGGAAGAPPRRGAPWGMAGG